MQNGSEKVPERIAIVGLGPTRQYYIDDVDRAGDRYKLFDEVWTFNSFCNIIDYDRLFHMDDVRVQELRAPKNPRVAGMLEALKRCQKPVYTSFACPDYPTLVEYPIREVIQRFSSLWFTSTPPYALAYAGLLGVKKATLYGMDYDWVGIGGSEPGKDCMSYWIAKVQGAGMQVNVHPRSSLMDCDKNTRSDIKLYGYDWVKVSLEAGETENTVKLIFTERDEPPSADEIEKRYFKHRPQVLAELEEN